MSLRQIFQNFRTSDFYLEAEEKPSFSAYSEIEKSVTETFSRPIGHVSHELIKYFEEFFFGSLLTRK